MTNEEFELAEKAIINGDEATLEKLLTVFKASPHARPWRNGNGNPHSLHESDAHTNARFIILREHHIESWPKITWLIQERSNPNSVVAKFEAAADAIVDGDIATVEKLIRENPSLVHERSKRLHRCTLLHYAGSNGIEDYRQKAPKNIAAIAELLLKAGAEVNAIAEGYGRDTTFGLASTSIHPQNSGVMLPLLDVLLNYGATIDYECEPGSAINACLANGRIESAKFLASRGGLINLEGAAGLGRLDLVKTFFAEDGALINNASAGQLRAGLCWACEYGQTEVVEFLLDRGVNVNTQYEGLQWAAFQGYEDIVRLFLPRHLPLDMFNRWGGTTLSAAVYGAEINTSKNHAHILQLLLDAGATIDAFAGLKERTERLLSSKK